MKTANAYTAEAAYHMENATQRMQPVQKLPQRASLPGTLQEITNYVEQLLSAKEESVCNMATD